MTLSGSKYKPVVVDTCTEYEHKTSDSFLWHLKETYFANVYTVLNFIPQKMRPIICLETSVRNSHSALRKIPKTSADLNFLQSITRSISLYQK